MSKLVVFGMNQNKGLERISVLQSLRLEPYLETKNMDKTLILFSPTFFDIFRTENHNRVAFIAP